MRPGVLVDRDGVLVRLLSRRGGWEAPLRLEEFRLLPGAAAAVARLRAAGLPVAVVTNQPELARGRLDPAVLAEMHRRLAAQLALDGIYVCPHDDAGKDGRACTCRKPRPGLVLRAAGELRLNLGASFLVGDGWRDVEAGRAAGVVTILVASPAEFPAGVLPDRRAADLPGAAAMILAEVERRHRRQAAAMTAGARRTSARPAPLPIPLARVG
jgi:D-glycero-D-manno-heptose 1,7-bisphosphate phosphatase